VRPFYLTFWVVLAAMFLYIVGSDFLGRGGAPWRSEVPLPAEELGPVAGWRGPAALTAAGVDLVLAPLHGDAARQAFDAQALEARFGLAPGEPWSLELSAADAEALAAFVEAAAGGLELRDDRGTAAMLLVDAAAEVEQGLEPAAAPVLQLFQPSEPSAEPRTENGRFVGRWVLWGRRPLAACTLAAGDVRHTLVPADLERDELPRFVASR